MVYSTELIGLAKPCPFCGNTPVIVKNPLHFRGPYFNNAFEYYVECYNPSCKSRIMCRSVPEDDIDYDEETCIKKCIDNWNRRV